MAFQDHFSSRAEIYSRARPTYPPALFERLAALAPGRALAWDCGTGNGQAAIGLAAHFAKVVATDPSEAQLSRAQPHPRVEYRLAQERASGLAPRSVDLAASAQAAHWFDLEAYYEEVRRVLRPDGIVALWCYNLLRIAPDIDAIIGRFYVETVGPFWPPERRHTEAGYQTLPFPFPELPFPAMTMKHDWTLMELGNYLRSWSAVMRFAVERRYDPVDALLSDLGQIWGPNDRPRRVEWPLAGRIGRLRES